MPIDHYPQIRVDGTDIALPERVKNDYLRYSDFKTMSEGGNGVLRSCYDNNLNRWVAMKTVVPKFARDPIQRRRLLREARVTAQLQHPNTVPVYELGMNLYGDLYFTMKRIEGSNLYERIRAQDERVDARASGVVQPDEDGHEELSLDRILGVLVQASNALDYAHTHGVIHRDVKPENILIGTYGEVYLMDWGVAWVRGMSNVEVGDDLDDEVLFERLTSTGKRPGTPLYMSPEQVSGEAIDERTDIFSLGVVLYEALTATEPFRGRNVQETFRNIREAEPEPPSRLAKEHVPEELDRICARALQKAPEDRYQTAADFVRDIRAFRDRAMHAT